MPLWRHVSLSFDKSNRVKEGYVLTPLNLFFLEHALQGLNRGVYLRYRLDSSLFDLQRQNATSKKTKRLILDALFADDFALMVHSDSDLQ